MVDYIDLRKEAYEKTMELRKSGLGWRRISKKLVAMGYKIPNLTLNGWIYGNHKPRYKEPLINDELTKERAYILGVIGPGDGYITDRKYEIGLSVIDKDFADYFQYCLENTFRLKTSRSLEAPHGLSNNNFHRVSLYSKKVREYLYKKYEVHFKEGSWRIPKAVKETNLNVIGSYLRGFADSQGSVGKRAIALASSNFEGMKEIKSLLDLFNIRSTLYKTEDGFIIAIYGRESLEIFNKEIGFAIKRKSEKLNNLLLSYKRLMVPSRIVDAKMPEIIRFLKEGNYKTLAAKKFGLHRLTITRRLKEMGVD